MDKANIDSKDIRKSLKQFFGFDRFKDSQETVIQSVLEGRNSFVIMPTGGGKSLCYQLPALMLEGTAIIVSPLIALMKNQVDAIRNHTDNPIIAHVYNSSLSKAEQTQVRSDLLKGGTKLLYMAPESLVKEDNLEWISKLKISFFAIDEAHCISEWGHDFRPEYRRIRQTIDAVKQHVPVMALTATATPKVQNDIQKNLGMMDADVYISSFNRPNIYYEIRKKTKDIDKDIVKFIKRHSGKSGIVYCLHRKRAEELADFLVLNKIKALPYHAGLETAVRTANQDKFLMEDVDVIVATIAFGMGIDKPDVRYVIHYDIPKSIEGYYQETGRVGRDDGEAICVAFYSYDDILKKEKLARRKSLSELEIVKQLLAEVVSYAESGLCRRKHLLFYFGEMYDKENCGSCDNCIHKKSMEEGKEYMLMLLKTIKESKQQFKEKHIINILLGNVFTDIQKYQHEELNCFGIGQEKSEMFWVGLIRQALFETLIVNSVENYGVFKITPKGEKYLKRPYSIQVVSEKELNDGDDGDDIDAIAPQKAGAVDMTLFSMLKDLLKNIAKDENLPPYVVFQETSLEDMCIQYPITMEEMTQIVGVGVGKAQKYGEPFIELIRKYVEENEIDRPQDIVVKSPFNESELKGYIIQNIDRQINLEDIAIAKKLTMGELLSKMESIVASGLKLNIDYYVDDYIDAYRREEILEYFYEKQEDSLEDALSELDRDEYTEEEIRLIRIKFLSDRGN